MKTIVSRFENAASRCALRPLVCILLSMLLLFPARNVYAQSDEDAKIPLKDNGFKESGDHLPKRDIELISLLPSVYYHASTNSMVIESEHITFDAVVYTIMDENGSVLLLGEIELPKGVEVELDLPNLHAGQYNIAIEIAGSVFIGDFFVEE